MADLALVTSLPEVKGVVLGDLEGVFHDAVNEDDGESIAAVMGFVCAAVLQAGETLGLGTLHRLSLSGPSRASVVLVDGQQVISAAVEPPKALAAVEKALDSSLSKGA
jgi:predicted regulator of Ras-like GTPase activity (Roadblock/LC7/MglB family)